MSRHTFSFFFLSVCSHSAKPPLSPPFHSHSSVSDVRSVPVRCSRFSRRCHLISVLCSSLYEGSLGPGVDRSRLNSAVELSCSVQIFLCQVSLGRRIHRLLAIAQRFVHFSTDPQPVQ